MSGMTVSDVNFVNFTSQRADQELVNSWQLSPVDWHVTGRVRSDQVTKISTDSISVLYSSWTIQHCPVEVSCNQQFSTDYMSGQ